MIRRCPQCATRWPEDLSECPHDGTPLSEPVPEDGDEDSLDLVETYGCEPGDELGQYRLIRLIGLGGMAAVFEAEHSVISQSVAVKVLRRELHDSAEDVRRFFHEARAITELAHPGIVECLDYVDGTEDNPPYLVMELVEGQTLAEVITARAPLPLSEATSIVTQICDAMIAVHDQGILHRDLKPANIMVLPPQPDEKTPRVKLLDFGVAKFLVTDEHFLRTATGAVLGTPEYMAPELVRGQKLSPTTDVYALGGVFYQLLTGRLPFVCDTLGQLIQHQLRIPAESPSKVAPPSHAEVISSSLDKLVLGCLAKSPEHRIASMSELKTRLKRVVEGDDTDVVVLTAHRSEPSPPRTRPGWIGPVLAGVAAALVALLGWWLIRGPAEPPARTPPQPATVTPAGPPDAAVSGPPRPRTRPAVLRSRVVTRPGGAAVFRESDGQYLGKTPMEVALPPTGKLRVVLRLAAHRDRTVVVQGDAPPLVVALTPRAKPSTGMSMNLGPARPMRPIHRPPPGMDPMSTDVQWGTVDPFRKKP